MGGRIRRWGRLGHRMPSGLVGLRVRRVEGGGARCKATFFSSSVVNCGNWGLVVNNGRLGLRAIVRGHSLLLLLLLVVRIG